MSKFFAPLRVIPLRLCVKLYLITSICPSLNIVVSLTCTGNTSFIFFLNHQDTKGSKKYKALVHLRVLSVSVVQFPFRRKCTFNSRISYNSYKLWEIVPISITFTAHPPSLTWQNLLKQ
jgi:hypothetical protein